MTLSSPVIRTGVKTLLSSGRIQTLSSGNIDTLRGMFKGLRITPVETVDHSANQWMTRSTNKRSPRTVVHTFWDVENVSGTQQDMVDFMKNYTTAVTKRFTSGVTPRMRTSIYHNPDDGRHLHRYLPKNSSVTIKKQFVDQGITVVDTASSESQQADTCIRRKMTEVMEDYNPGNTVIVLISGDAGFIDLLEQCNKMGFTTHLVSNFDCISNKFKQVRWLEIWSFFVIAHGDTRKVEGKDIPLTGRHPKFGDRTYSQHHIRHSGGNCRQYQNSSRSPTPTHCQTQRPQVKYFSSKLIKSKECVSFKDALESSKVK